MDLEAPTGEELAASPLVREAIEAAWTDSLPADPSRRHEEGGWIYLNLATGELSVRRAAIGARAAINLSRPPELAGCVVVGKFHTHPNPTADGWNPGPSQSDIRADGIHGVPDLIRADNDLYYSGPTKRRGGLTGPPGYPLPEA